MQNGTLQKLKQSGNEKNRKALEQIVLWFYEMDVDFLFFFFLRGGSDNL